MENRANRIILAVALGQFIPVFLYPPQAYASVSPVIIAIAVGLFVVLAYYLFRRRPWAKTLTIFLQGFNIIARIMIVLSNGAEPIKKGGEVNLPIIVTSLVAILLSLIVLYRFDVPEIETAFNA